MKKRTLIAVLGLWIALLPFLGLPATWKSRLVIISGLVVTVLAVSRKKSGTVYAVSENPAASSASVRGSSVSSPVSSAVTHSMAPQTSSHTVIKKPRKPRTIKIDQPKAVETPYPMPAKEASEGNRAERHAVDAA